jgi:hypothetical protein
MEKISQARREDILRIAVFSVVAIAIGEGCS